MRRRVGSTRLTSVILGDGITPIGSVFGLVGRRILALNHMYLLVQMVGVKGCAGRAEKLCRRV